MVTCSSCVQGDIALARCGNQLTKVHLSAESHPVAQLRKDADGPERDARRFSGSYKRRGEHCRPTNVSDRLGDGATSSGACAATNRLGIHF